MSSMPAAIIFVNNDLNDLIISILRDQLYLDDLITLEEFNERVEVDPNYVFLVHSMGLRVLVILDTFQDFTNRQLADICLFIKNGLAYRLEGNNGPPRECYSIYNLNIENLLRANNIVF
jgi:hypothetical protein